MFRAHPTEVAWERTAPETTTTAAADGTGRLAYPYNANSSSLDLFSLIEKSANSYASTVTIDSDALASPAAEPLEPNQYIVFHRISIPIF